jgi:hypothetical protein
MNDHSVGEYSRDEPVARMRCVTSLGALIVDVHWPRSLIKIEISGERLEIRTDDARLVTDYPLLGGDT